MPDYIYLLENRLSADQRHALSQLREAAREAGMILFLTGDAVRDLTSGHAVRELEVAIHGNALKLKKTIEKLGGRIWGEDAAAGSLYLCFPGTVRVDLIGTHRVEYPKPGKAVVHPASIQEDLRRRDFTVNAMAISLNEGSFGLLMDPLNGVADIEARTLRLVSNYGFIEDPSLLLRAVRYQVRLGWELDPKTRTRYENAKGDAAIEYLSPEARSRELEAIGHEEESLKVLRAMENEGWMKVLYPAWTSAKADEERLTGLHDLAVELALQGVHPDMSAAQMQLLTARMGAKDLAGLKKLMLRPGFLEEWNSLDSLAAGFAKVLLAKENQAPSTCFKLFRSYDPEAILWLGFTSNDAAVKERFNLFLKVWPDVRQRIPYALMQEMRITPDSASYAEIVQSVFLELIDGRLTTPDEQRAFLEPHSPPAPPPQVTIKRPRAKRGAEAKLKEHSYDDEDEAEDADEEDEDLDDLGGDEDEIDLGLSLPKVDLDSEIAGDVDTAEEDMGEEEEEATVAPPKRVSKAQVAPKAGKAVAAVSPSAKHDESAEPASGLEPAVIKTSVKPPIEAAKAHTAASAAMTGSLKATVQGASTESVKPPQKVTGAPASKPAVLSGSVKPPQSGARALAAKPAASLPVKTATATPAAKKAAPKPPAKPAPKAPVKAAAKKATPVKAKVAPAAKPKAVKSAVKAQKPAPKKPAGKPAKKR